MRRPLLLTCAACALTAVAAPPAAVTPSGDSFAAALGARWCAEPGNVIFSPHSLASALAMTASGARGETASQIAAALRLAPTAEGLPAALAALGRQLEDARAASPRLELRSAQSLWVQQGLALRPPFVDAVRGPFAGEVADVDYVGAPEAARTRVNDWVAGRTANRIRDLIAPGVFTAQTRLTLVNAVYFKAPWARPFDPARTYDAPFQVADGSRVTVPFMRQLTRLRHAATDELQAVELPYAGGRLAMLVILPRPGLAPAALARRWPAEGLTAWESSLASQEVALELPRFTFRWSRSCAADLRALGIADAFDPARADLSGMAGEPGELVLSAVVHQAFIEVTEEGTEAAAATAGVVATTAAVRPRPPVVFRADRPFLFLIREARSGCVLFAGVVANPGSR